MSASNNLQQQWSILENKLMKRFGKKANIEAILFLIGIQETNFQFSQISKEQKQDLIHIAVCTILAPSGYVCFEKFGRYWPQFKQLKVNTRLFCCRTRRFFKRTYFALF
jgi:hypothetical protein